MTDYRIRLKELKEKIEVYENTYSKSFEAFSRDVPISMKGHDDWIEWSYLSHVANELERNQQDKT